jgi:hypothetical protein
MNTKRCKRKVESGELSNSYSIQARFKICHKEALSRKEDLELVHSPRNNNYKISFIRKTKSNKRFKAQLKQ